MRRPSTLGRRGDDHVAWPSWPPSQCRKWRWPVNTMASPASSAALMTSSSRTEPPGWMTAVAPASAAARRPSAKGKNASEATTDPFARLSGKPASRAASAAFQAAMREESTRRHLAGADADGRAVARIDDGVRLDVLGDPEGEDEVGQLPARGRAPRHHRERPCRRRRRCRAPARGSRPPRCAGVRPGARGSGRAPARRSRRFFLAAMIAIASSRRVRRDDHLGENLDDPRGRLGVERAVEGDDAAEGRDRIAAQRPLVGVAQAVAFGDAARIGVLDDDDGRRVRRIELGDAFIGRVGVVDVVVGELLALHLPGRGDAGARLGRAVERGRLMRVLAVAHAARRACRRAPGRRGVASPISPASQFEIAAS